jgi:hypothetical protein
MNLGFLKSKTVWASLAVAALPYSDMLTGVATGVSPVAGAVISAVFIILRAVTNKPLSDK